jgi:hypothetical protein
MGSQMARRRSTRDRADCRSLPDVQLSQPPDGRSTLDRFVAERTLPAELTALVLTLAEQGVPLVVASTNATRAAALRRAFTIEVLAIQPTRDAVAGGVILGRSLEEVLRLLGAGASSGTGTRDGDQSSVGSDHDHATDVPDEARDLGVVLVLDEERLAVAHYVRPVERDGAGHLQRRPPAVLGAWNDAAQDFDDFSWALTDELARRAGLERHELEDAVEARRRRLAGAESGPGPPDARH